MLSVVAGPDDQHQVSVPGLELGQLTGARPLMHVKAGIGLQHGHQGMAVGVVGLVHQPEADRRGAAELEDAEDQHDEQRNDQAEEERGAVPDEHLHAGDKE